MNLFLDSFPGAAASKYHAVQIKQQKSQSWRLKPETEVQPQSLPSEGVAGSAPHWFSQSTFLTEEGKKLSEVGPLPVPMKHLGECLPFNAHKDALVSSDTWKLVTVVRGRGETSPLNAFIHSNWKSLLKSTNPDLILTVYQSNFSP